MQTTEPTVVGECPYGENGICPFPEEHLTGALDGVLTRVDAARVEQRIRDCPRCRGLYEEIQLNRDAARTTRFPAPPDEQWDETPRGLLSRVARNAGLLLFAMLVVVSLTLAFVRPSFLEPELIETWLLRLAIIATLAVLVSVGIDRFRAAKKDVYRGVRR